MVKTYRTFKINMGCPPTGKLYVFTSNQIVCNNKDCVQSLRLLGPILLIFTGVGLRWVVGGEGLIGRVGRVGLVGDDNQS